ncbi:hypothetical protein [Phycisphaera mikurensis]|uniref:Anti-sigma factor n=1 Tax=Phycisphaera mikurensis (strain NBRC 102666 / KCTC 22515 / FYK2301M01) TaxID=1142394 RepID=I0IBK5_PHYMF|nr:hypothetical protein [Phycisphaera mikurensis]MBB6442827.1 hypothetical protein [Phycisphaera mikurensis]BAM02643.1 hypothetical protein PSMK_04840 [Phycisphaera mikurensis NBRC 102666]
MTPPAEDLLDAALRRHYAANGPDAAALRRLREAVHPASTPASRPRLRAAWLAVAAALTLTASLAIVLAAGGGGSDALASLVAEEIALNHRKQLAPEWTGVGIGELAERMPKLDFTPRWPAALDGGGWSLTGARYCSIGGRIAAQLRLGRADGRAATLYAFRDADAFAALPAGQRSVDGTSVRVWREGGLVFGLAAAPAPGADPPAPRRPERRVSPGSSRASTAARPD